MEAAHEFPIILLWRKRGEMTACLPANRHRSNELGQQNGQHYLWADFGALLALLIV